MPLSELLDIAEKHIKTDGLKEANAVKFV